jgi:hypothetical protein
MDGTPGNSNSNRDPCGMTTKKATATAKATADPFGMTTRKATATATADPLRGLFFAEDVSHAADLGADAAEFFFEVLVAAVEVVDAVEDGFAVGD